jgi:hypothetical protein
MFGDGRMMQATHDGKERGIYRNLDCEQQDACLCPTPESTP